MTIANANQLIENHEIAFLRANVCTGSPESYTLDEKRMICGDIEASTAEIKEAIKADFEGLPLLAQAAMLDLLQEADPEHFDWWLEMLVGKTPDAPPAR